MRMLRLLARSPAALAAALARGARGALPPTYGNARFIWSDMQLAIDFGDQPNCFVRIGLTCRIGLD